MEYKYILAVTMGYCIYISICIKITQLIEMYLFAISIEKRYFVQTITLIIMSHIYTIFVAALSSLLQQRLDILNSRITNHIKLRCACRIWIGGRRMGRGYFILFHIISYYSTLIYNCFNVYAHYHINKMYNIIVFVYIYRC